MKLKKPNSILNKKEGTNKKALYWLIGSAVGVVVIVSVLMIFNV